jgi:hypothetical protein
MSQQLIDPTIETVATFNSGSNEPDCTLPYMLWADTTSGKMQQRNAANTAWIELWDLVSGISSTSAITKNYIIDPDFIQWPEGTTVTAPADGKYGPALFKVVKATTGAVVDLIRSTTVPTVAESNHGSSCSLQADVTTADATVDAGDLYALEYDVTGHDFAYMDQQTVTLSFWARSAKTGTHCVAFRNSAKNRNYIAEYTMSAANTWEKQTISLTLDTSGSWLKDTGVGLRISWALMAGSTYQGTANTWQTGDLLATSNQVNVLDNAANNFHIAQVQLELGSSATTFVAPLTATVQDQVDYYVQKFGGLGGFDKIASGLCVNTTISQSPIFFRRGMRVAPSMSVTDQTKI